MYLHLTKEEESSDSAAGAEEVMKNWGASEEAMEQEEPTIFDPKSFLESLFNSRQAEIELLLHNGTSYNQNITR